MKTILDFENDLRIKEVTMIKNKFFSYKTEIEIKGTTTTVIKNELKYSLMSEGNTCIAKPNLEAGADQGGGPGGLVPPRSKI